MLDLIILDDAEDDLLNAYDWYEAKEHGHMDPFLEPIRIASAPARSRTGRGTHSSVVLVSKRLINESDEKNLYVEYREWLFLGG